MLYINGAIFDLGFTGDFYVVGYRLIKVLCPISETSCMAQPFDLYLFVLVLYSA